MRSNNNGLACCKHENCTTSSCVYDIAWGPHDCNYISWNKAVCTYPHFVSDDSAETSHMSCNWNAVICTYPHSLKEMGAPRQVSHSQRKSKENRDCLELPPRKAGSKRIVNLQPPKPDRDDDDDGNEDGARDELARTTSNMYIRSIFEAWDEDADKTSAINR